MNHYRDRRCRGDLAPCPTNESLAGRSGPCTRCVPCSTARTLRLRLIARAMREALRPARSLPRETRPLKAHAEPHDPEKRCSVCYGMPDARTNDRAPRTMSGRIIRAVVDDFGRCIRCHEPWGPPEPIERCSGYGQSSSAMARSAALFHGVDMRPIVRKNAVGKMGL